MLCVMGWRNSIIDEVTNMAYADNVAIGTKRRRNVKKTYQDTSNAYSSGGNNSSTYNTGDYTLSKTKGVDKLQGTKEEKRGRSNKGNAKRKYKTTGQKSRQRHKSNTSKARRGGK